MISEVQLLVAGVVVDDVRMVLQVDDALHVEKVLGVDFLTLGHGLEAIHSPRLVTDLKWSIGGRRMAFLTGSHTSQHWKDKLEQ